MATGVSGKLDYHQGDGAAIETQRLKGLNVQCSMTGALQDGFKEPGKY